MSEHAASLDRFDPADLKLVVALPYRAGLFVSFSDVSGGWTAQDRELQALSEVLRYQASEADMDDFCRAVVMETLAARKDWPAWSHDIGAVPAEAKAVSGILKKVLTAGEKEHFNAMLIGTARAVATAFQEEDGLAEEERSFLPDMLRRILRKDEDFDPRAISARERAALQALQKALD